MDVPFEELEWARVASLLDAEGCMRKNQACMDIRMNDEDLIRFCHRVTGVRNTVNSRQLPTGSTQWVLYITGKDQVTRCLKRMMPYFGERRTKQAERLLQWIEQSAYKSKNLNE